MSETKKKSSWLFWIVVAISFLALIYYLLISLLSDGHDQAENIIYERLLNYTSVWSEELASELTMSERCGGIISTVMENEGAGLFDERLIRHVDDLAQHAYFDRIYICDNDGKVVDNKGEKRDISSFSFSLNGSESTEVRYLFLDKDDLGNEKVFVATYPLTEGYLIFFYDLDEVSKNLVESGYENVSFALLFKKDGTILRTVPTFADKDSKFVTGSNLLSAVQSGTTREKYNIFKSKLYSITGCAIATSYDGDERTVVVSPLNVSDWYIAMGIRQYQIDYLVKAEFASVRSTVVKLMIVLSIFTVFIIGTSIVNTAKSKEKGRILEDKADMDQLTGLTNKVATERMITEYMENNKTERGVLFILDIDNFKKVNDTMGHAFGDTLLKTLGKEIRSEFRVTDIVGRTGGDEFMIFLKNITDDLIVEREANRINRFFHEFKAGDDYVKYSATASIGVAIFPEDGASFKDLYVSADQALYRAKKRGKNQLVFFNEDRYGKQL